MVKYDLVLTTGEVLNCEAFQKKDVFDILEKTDGVVEVHEIDYPDMATFVKAEDVSHVRILMFSEEDTEDTEEVLFYLNDEPIYATSGFSSLYDAIETPFD